MREDIGLLDDMPSRRWEIIALLVESKRQPSRRPEDASVRRGYHFLRRYTRADSFGKLAVRRDYPDLYWAYGMYDDPCGERWIVEAGLLTDLPRATLAEFVGKPESVINTYEDMFFDVRHRLNSRGYILNRILMPSYDRGIGGRDFDLLYKTLAYCCGWEVFSEFIDSRKLSDSTRAHLGDLFKDRMLKLGWMATHRLEVNQYTALEIIDKCLRLQELENQAKQAGGRGREEATAQLGELLTHCVTTMLPTSGEVMLNEPRIEGYDTLQYGDPIPLKDAEVANGKTE